MRITISAGDDVLRRSGERLAEAGAAAPRILARALNHEGDKGATQIKRSLAQVTGIKPSQVSVGFRVRRASPGSLIYEIVQRGDETNLGSFRARQGKRGVSAAPWNQRRVFPGTFVGGAGRVFHRLGRPRYPIEPLWGPNLAREIVQGEPLAAFEAIPLRLASRVAAQLDFDSF